MYFMSLTSNHFNAPEMARDTWTETNDSARYPVFTNGDSVLKRNFSRSDNAMFWEDASYLCAREMVLSYDLPAAWTRKAYREKVTLSLTGQNLFYITGCKSYTPEYGSKEADLYGLRAYYYFHLFRTYGGVATTDKPDVWGGVTSADFLNLADSGHRGKPVSAPVAFVVVKNGCFLLHYSAAGFLFAGLIRLENL